MPSPRGKGVNKKNLGGANLPLKPPTPPQLDPSDPHATIRKLLKLVEMLQVEKDQLQTEVDSSAGCSSEEMQSELQSLRAENANMFILKEENNSLRRQVEKFKKSSRRRKSGDSAADSDEESQVSKLQSENRVLQTKLASITSDLELLKQVPINTGDVLEMSMSM